MKKSLVLFFISFAFIYSARATHLRAGQITVKQTPGSLTCQITVTVFTNTANTNVLFGGESEYLTFGDGAQVLVPETQNTYSPGLGPGVGIASFTTFHTYRTAGSYLIGYSEANRNGGIINMTGSVNTRFYVETFISITEDGAPYETPVLLMDQPVLNSIVQTEYAESLACMDVNDYRLYYQLVTPQADRNTDVMQYILPEGMTIDSVSGLLTWDTKFKGFYPAGEFAFAVRIYQIKDNTIVGYMLRDFQLILQEGDTEVRSLDGGAKSNKSVFLPEGTTTRFRVAAGGENLRELALVVRSELEKFPQNFSYTIEDSTHDEMRYKVAKITVTSAAEIDRNNPYIISVRAVFNEGYSSRMAKDLTYVVATREVEGGQPLPPLPPITDGDTSFGVRISPNPVGDLLKITNRNNATVRVQIHDLHGKVWLQRTIERSTDLDLQPLTPGVYLCTLVKDKDVLTYKIVKN